MIRHVGGFLALVAAFALALWLGWWTVPAVAALWGLLRPAVWRPILSAALAATLGTGFWLLVDGLAGSGAVTRLGSRLAGVLHLPFALLLLLTLLFPTLLAWSAAALACGLAGIRAPRSEGAS
jgi:hypothetical protein